MDRRSEKSLGRKLSFIVHDVWEPSKSVKEVLEGTPIPDIPARPESPDILPPGLAIGAENGPERSRQASKVQDLVEKFEGIAKRNVSAELVLAPQESIPNEEGPESSPQAEDQNPASKEKDRQDISMERGTVEGVNGISKKTTTAYPAEEVPRITIESDHEERITAPEPTPRVRKPLDIHISIDLTQLDILFPNTKPMNTSPGLVPDVIIDDTFTSVSERKSWYRLSRPGSMRMHNLGANEDYVRVDWVHSTARDDTLKIVRRWLEEDSITGRVVLGRKGGPIGASMFNWDSNAPPVEIDELLRRKPSRQASKMSLQSRGPVISPTGSSFTRSSVDIKPTKSFTSTNRSLLLAMPAADFGWGSPKSSPISSSFKPVTSPTLDAAAFGGWESLQSSPLAGPLTILSTEDKLKDEAVSSRPSSLVMSPASAGINSPAKSRPRSLFIAPLQSIKQTHSLNSPVLPSDKSSNGQDDNDNGWGEMVSPSLQTNRHFNTATSNTKESAVSPISNGSANNGNVLSPSTIFKNESQIIDQSQPSIVSAKQSLDIDPWASGNGCSELQTSKDETSAWASEPEVAVSTISQGPTSSLPSNQKSTKTVMPSNSTSVSPLGPVVIQQVATNITPTFIQSPATVSPIQPTLSHTSQSPVESKYTFPSKPLPSFDDDDETIARILVTIPSLSYMFR